jgi:hypothetical protein
MLTWMVLLIAGLMVLYVGYLHLQLYISRRIINALQETTLAVEERSGRAAIKPALAALGLLILVAGVVATWAG